MPLENERRRESLWLFPEPLHQQRPVPGGKDTARGLYKLGGGYFSNIGPFCLFDSFQVEMILFFFLIRNTQQSFPHFNWVMVICLFIDQYMFFVCFQIVSTYQIHNLQTCSPISHLHVFIFLLKIHLMYLHVNLCFPHSFQQWHVFNTLHCFAKFIDKNTPHCITFYFPRNNI